MSTGDGMAVQAMMNGVPFILSTTVSGVPGSATSSPARAPAGGNGTETGAGSASQIAVPGSTSSSAGDDQKAPSVQIAAILVGAVLALLVDT